MPAADTFDLVLASASPRRSDLLGRAGIAFEVIPADLDETALAGESARAQAERLAREKALAVAHGLDADRNARVLGSDTLVVLDGEALGKPRDAEHAVKLLSRLLGRSHVVVTGVALVDCRDRSVRSCTVESTVVMRSADESEVRRYVAGGEPMDKAGAYAAQGDGRRFVERIEGSETNVIGLPMDETLALLAESRR
jgi:septum formation protein